MKAKLLTLSALVVGLMVTSCTKDHIIEVPAASDITITFEGNVNEFTDTMPLGSTITLKADIASTVGLESVVCVKLYKLRNSVVLDPIDVPEAQANNYSLTLPILINDSCYNYEFKGVQVIAINLNGEVASKTFSCTGEVLDDPNYYKFTNKLIQNFLDGIPGNYTPAGNNFFASTLARTPIIDWSIANNNQSKIEWFLMADIDDCFGTPEKGEYPFGIMSAACPNKPKTMAANGLNGTGQHTFFRQISSDATTQGYFNSAMTGDVALEDVVAGFIKAGKIPVNEREIWIGAGVVILFKVGGGTVLASDLLAGNAAAIQDITTSRWGLLRINSNWDTSGQVVPSGRPALLDQTASIDVILQKPSNAGIPLSKLQ